MIKITKTLLTLLLLLVISYYSQAQCGTVISTFPYTEDFETAPAWTTGGTNNDWAWGSPTHPFINSAGSGTKCWSTGGLTGSFYRYSELAWIMSPCFDFSNLNYPWISFKIFWEDEWKYDGLVLQYSLNGGTTWTNVGAYGDAVNCLNDNWYDYNNITWLTSANPKNGWTGRRGATVGSCQGGNGSLGWVNAKHCLSALANKPSVRFRFLFGAGTTCNDYDGIAVDDILIDNAPPNAANFTYACAGANTVNFTNTSAMCPTGYVWNFGDGTATSNATSPSHIYALGGTYNVTLTASGPCNAPSTIVIPVSVLGVTTNITNVSCTGSSSPTITANATGTSGTISYSWSPGGATTATITGLSTGTYTVTVTASGSCSASATATIAPGGALSTSTTITSVSCFGGNDGTATVTANGGSSPYTYSWAGGSSSPTYTGLTAGTYTATVTDMNGCTGSSTATVTQPTTPITFTASSSPITCYGGSNGSASVVVSGGNSPYTYLWSGGSTSSSISGAPAGTYIVAVTDNNNCTKKDTIHITEPINPSDSIHLATTFCEGDAEITLHLQPNLGSYSWFAGTDTSGIVLSTVDSLVVHYPVAGSVYTIVIHNSLSSCPLLLTYSLIYSPPLNLPNYIVKSNVFTPDGDGKNDKFDLNQFAFVKDFHIEIYNRWGLKVFESNDLSNQWDGKINGSAAAEGVYFWIANYTSLCTPDGESHQNNGFVQLLRGK